jgi:biopolymer transport protein ExbB
VAATLLAAASGAAPPGAESAVGQTLRALAPAANRGLAWYRATPPLERMSWGGLAVCGLLVVGIGTVRTWRVRAALICPRRFVDRLREGLRSGRLDRHKAADLCEMNPSAAGRVAMAAVQRWGRPTADLERAVALAQRIECDAMWTRVGALRRIAVLAPLVGLLGTLAATTRLLSGSALTPAGLAWNAAAGGSLDPLSAGVALAIVALVAYDGLAARIDSFTAALQRLGSDVIDAIDSAPRSGTRPDARADQAGVPSPFHSREPAPGARASERGPR